MEPRGAGNALLDERVQKVNHKKHRLRVSNARKKGDPISQKHYAE